MNNLKNSAHFENYFSPVHMRIDIPQTSIPVSQQFKETYCDLFDLKLTASTEANLLLELAPTQDNQQTLLTFEIEMSPAQELLYKELPLTIIKQTQEEDTQVNNSIVVPSKTHTKTSKKKDSRSNLRAILKRRAKPTQRAQWTTRLMSEY